MTRRRLLRRAAAGMLGAAGVISYPALETRWCRMAHVRLPVPNLPAAFAGATIAFVADVHHGPDVPLSYVRHVARLADSLDADYLVLGGDYVSKDPRYIAPGIAELGRIGARSGRFAVLGNHDHWEDPIETRSELARAGITDLSNRGVWLERGGARLRLAGVDDLWCAAQDIDAALGPARSSDAVILVSHNPDYAEEVDDRRVGLILSGHTHGGQVDLPGVARWVPSRYGRKYLRGLVNGPTCRVFITTGIGTSGPPVRLFCRPEVVRITLIADRPTA